MIIEKGALALKEVPEGFFLPQLLPLLRIRFVARTLARGGWSRRGKIGRGRGRIWDGGNRGW